MSFSFSSKLILLSKDINNIYVYIVVQERYIFLVDQAERVFFSFQPRKIHVRIMFPTYNLLSYARKGISQIEDTNSDDGISSS